MKVTIENKFYPSLIEMENCAQVLYYGLVEKNTKHILSIEEANLLKELLKIYTQTYKRHTDNGSRLCVRCGNRSRNVQPTTKLKLKNK